MYCHGFRSYDFNDLLAVEKAIVYVTIVLEITQRLSRGFKYFDMRTIRFRPGHIHLL